MSAYDPKRTLGYLRRTRFNPGRLAGSHAPRHFPFWPLSRREKEPPDDRTLVQKSIECDTQAITAADLTKMATTEGGRIAELPLGSLAPGQMADFIVIDLSDLALVPNDRLESHMVYSMSDRAIRHVYVHGKPAVKDGKLCGIEEAELRRRVVASTRRFFQRSDPD